MICARNIWTYNARFHILGRGDEPPEGIKYDDPYWRTRELRAICGRVIEASPTGDRYSDGSALPLCKRCVARRAALGFPVTA